MTLPSFRTPQFTEWVWGGHSIVVLDLSTFVPDRDPNKRESMYRVVRGRDDESQGHPEGLGRIGGPSRSKVDPNWSVPVIVLWPLILLPSSEKGETEVVSGVGGDVEEVPRSVTVRPDGAKIEDGPLGPGVLDYCEGGEENEGQVPTFFEWRQYLEPRQSGRSQPQEWRG